MTTRICPFCGKEFSSGASYRVHKSKYHRGQQEPEKLAELPAEKTITETTITEELANQEKDIDEQEETEEHSGAGWSWLLGLGGLAGLLLLIFLGRRGGQQ
jgi:hypothetical protein